jgi:hypothetical protein
MRALPIVAFGFIIALFSSSCGSSPVSSSSESVPSSPQAAASTSSGKITGFAFVDSSVTGQGAKAKLPDGTKIYPPGSTASGTDGCPTTRYRTDGQPVVVIDYTGRSTAGSITITRHPAAGGDFTGAPYYIDLDPGRTLQNMGPIFDNGTYDIVFSYDYNTGQGHKTSAKLILNRNCSF